MGTDAVCRGLRLRSFRTAADAVRAGSTVCDIPGHLLPSSSIPAGHSPTSKRPECSLEQAHAATARDSRCCIVFHIIGQHVLSASAYSDSCACHDWTLLHSLTSEASEPTARCCRTQVARMCHLMAAGDVAAATSARFTPTDAKHCWTDPMLARSHHLHMAPALMHSTSRHPLGHPALSLYNGVCACIPVNAMVERPAHRGRCRTYVSTFTCIEAGTQES